MPASETRRLSVKALCGADAASECRRSAVAGRKVLHAYGIANITSAADEWWRDPETFTLLLDDAASGEPLGGVRLQRFRRGVALPFERALDRVDPRVHAFAESFVARGAGELCGLWRALELRGLGIGWKLTAMGIALATQARVDVLFGLCDTRHVRDNARLGFGVEPALASNGTFVYPRAGLVAHVLRLDDAVRLPKASAEARALVEHYRNEPVGVEVVRNGERTVELHRDLRLSPAIGQVHGEAPREHVP